MCSPRELTGEFADHDTPTWDPLEELLGGDLPGWFMWMYALDFDDGTLVHAYKHTHTRRYCFISEQGGRTFAYTPRGRYRPLAPRDAIKGAFECWRALTPPECHAAVATDLRKAVRRASPVAR